jgi:glycosyltransferase involved in cell wall biosynthesis
MDERKSPTPQVHAQGAVGGAGAPWSLTDKGKRHRVACISANTAWYLYNFRSELIAMLRSRGYHVVCLCPKDDYSARLQAELGAEVVPLQMNSDGLNPIDDLLVFLQMLRAYRRYRPTLALHFTAKNNIYGTLAAASLGIPSVNDISGLGTAFIHGGLVLRIVRQLYRLSQKLAFRVFCENSDDYHLLVSYGLVPADRLNVLPGAGVDTERFHPKFRKPRGLRPFRYLYAGRILADKGLYELIQAFKQVQQRDHNCQLWLLGFAGVANRSAIPIEIIEQWRRLPGVVFHGATDRVDNYMADVDCVVLPSYREGLPKSLLEALAMEIPVIATDVPGCRAIVKHNETGLLVKPADVQSLSDAMEVMRTMDSDARAELGVAGRRLVDSTYRVDAVVGAYVDALVAIEQQRDAVA